MTSECSMRSLEIFVRGVELYSVLHCVSVWCVARSAESWLRHGRLEIFFRYIIKDWRRARNPVLVLIDVDRWGCCSGGIRKVPTYNLGSNTSSLDLVLLPGEFWCSAYFVRHRSTVLAIILPSETLSSKHINGVSIRDKGEGNVHHRTGQEGPVGE
jgi:hypothetical protein